MIRKVKARMLVALAALAVGVIGVSAAQAEENSGQHFETPGNAGGVTIAAAPDGTAKNSHHVFDISNEAGNIQRSITCGSITAHGATTEESQNDIKVTFQYGGGCQFIGQEVEVNSGDCDYTFHAANTVDVVGAECAIGEKPITFETAQCKVEVGSQAGLGGIGYKYLAEKENVTLSANVTGIVYKATGADCPFGETGNGRYTTGNTIVKGTVAGEEVNVLWTE